MILQLGALLSGAVSGLGNILGQVATQLAPVGIDIGKQFLARELGRRDARAQKDALKAAATAALNSPGISVATIGGRTVPVGGAVQRSTYVPSVIAPAQSPLGNVPLPTLPVLGPGGANTRGPGMVQRGLDAITQGAFSGRGGIYMPRVGARPLNGSAVGPPFLPGARGEPKYAVDEFGKAIKFWCSPIPGEGYLPVEQARALGRKPKPPYYRFNRLQSQYERIKRRTMNPLNIRATERAGRRVMATIDTVKDLLKIEKQMTTGRVRLRKRPKRRKRRRSTTRKRCCK